MSPPLPGQRAAQKPMRAALAAHRAIARVVHDSSSLSGELLLNVGGGWQATRVGEDGQEFATEFSFEEEE